MCVLIALAGADALLLEGDRIAKVPKENESNSNVITAFQSSSSVAPVPSEGVRKQSGPDVIAYLKDEEIEITQTREQSLSEQIIPASVATVQSRILMQDDDRLGLIAWTDSPQVKVYYLALKEALHTTFSPELRDLIDETQRREDKPPRNLLTFVDPVISEERIVFVRVRERLYEFHVAEGKDEEIFGIIEGLTK